MKKVKYKKRKVDTTRLARKVIWNEIWKLRDEFDKFRVETIEELNDIKKKL